MIPEILQLNKFADLDNGKTIIFCRTDRLIEQFKVLNKLKHQVILISGNSDANITPALAAALPDNVIAWYSQNNLCYHPKIFCIPIGIENTELPKKRKSGTAWQHAKEKLSILTHTAHAQKHPTSKLIYANFNVSTNIKARSVIKDLCIKSDHITWEEPDLTYNNFVNNVLQHEAVICPAGNGIDTHRLYEILYCGRIAITIKTGDYAIYDHLYHQLPVIIIEDPMELADDKHMLELITAMKRKAFNNNILDFNYWKGMILKSSALLQHPEPSFLNKLLHLKF